jgi:hypothetical protein
VAKRPDLNNQRRSPFNGSIIQPITRISRLQIRVIREIRGQLNYMVWGKAGAPGGQMRPPAALADLFA